jgi:hypothetical protein
MRQSLVAVLQSCAAFVRWCGELFVRRAAPSPEQRRAMDLIAAIDAGGVPLNPARVNDIARKLGLEVSKSEAVEHTIARIRAALGAQLR